MKIRVEFEVPDDIEKGLSKGTLERVGGVIRFKESKQVVAWLRDGGKMSRDASSTSNLLPSLLRAAGMNARTVTVVAGAVTVAGPMLDVAITAYTIVRLKRQIEYLKDEISDIYDRLDRQFEKGRSAALRTALDRAEEFISRDNFITRQGMLDNVIDKLVHAEKLLLDDFDDAMKNDQLVEAGSIIAAAITVNTMAARCLLEFGDEKTAIYRLQKNLIELKPKVESLVETLVGDQPALYFHKSVTEEFLDRYIKAQEWLRGENDVWESVVKEARSVFWTRRALRRLVQMNWRRQRFIRQDPFYINAIPQAEQLIENYQRFEGYVLELESADRPFRDWELLSEEAAAARLADHDDYVLLIDEDAIDRMDRLSA